VIVVITQLGTSNLSDFTSSIYFFINLTFFYLFTVGVKVCCCTLSQSITHTSTHTHSVGVLSKRYGSVRDLYLSTHSTSSAGFEPVTPVSERPQTYALDSAAAGTGFRSDTIGHNLCRHISVIFQLYPTKLQFTML
jgi:hypothetical protein